jgi:O-acetyl-ADP-ribose deacetylase (regulator of RNase III)
LGGCQTGEAKRSPGFELPVKHIIHTVGPVWQGGDKGEAELLRSCNTNSFQLALQFGVKRIAFPCISTGVCGFPKENAPTIALTAMRQYEPSLERIVAYCYAEADAELYRRLHHA